eukprot:TRINITY_DN759_c0_g1_i1.p1 TRINITY_DN759_c0_g1~~TRINITY_DN759_c0_g1_i1.p1  ORF type:complete len:181 (-),score=29.61 TRINITY_DN759_c0_g1_i1:27-569(-)
MKCFLLLALATIASASTCTRLLHQAEAEAMVCRQVPSPPAEGFCELVVPEIMGCCASNSSWQKVRPGFVPETWLALEQACGQATVQLSDAPLIHCEWDHTSAPFYISVVNSAGESVRIRQCPKKYTKCTGDMTQPNRYMAVSYTHLRAHETPEHLVCRLLLEKKKKKRLTIQKHQQHTNV